jgi:selenide,water dikinase
LERGVSEIDLTLMADAQTSGGMLISVPEDRVDELVKSLVANHTLYSDAIGRVIAKRSGSVYIKP